jgi:hypothetical protein
MKAAIVLLAALTFGGQAKAESLCVSAVKEAYSKTLSSPGYENFQITSQKTIADYTKDVMCGEHYIFQINFTSAKRDGSAIVRETCGDCDVIDLGLEMTKR